MWSKIWGFVILFASWFLVPALAVQVYQNPGNYWSWFSLTIWVYLMLSEIVSLFTARAMEEK